MKVGKVTSPLFIHICLLCLKDLEISGEVAEGGSLWKQKTAGGKRFLNVWTLKNLDFPILFRCTGKLMGEILMNIDLMNINEYKRQFFFWHHERTYLDEENNN